MARALGRLARLRVHDLRRQPVLGRATTAGLIHQPGDPLLGVAVQPQPHHIFLAVVDLGDLWHPVAPSTQQHHLGARRRPGEPHPRTRW